MARREKKPVRHVQMTDCKEPSSRDFFRTVMTVWSESWLLTLFWVSTAKAGKRSFHSL